MLLFSFLGVLFIPFTFRHIRIHSRITQFFFEDLILFIHSHFEGISLKNPAVSSDSTTLYLLFVILFVISILFVSLFSRFGFWTKNSQRIEQAIQIVLVYYLSVVMLKYGFDKIFKAQFYLPEPNTLYTPLGMLDKDILYWSTMGTSRIYNILIGLMEVIPAVLILFRRTRILGLLLLTVVLINVVFVNFGFDISVKLYSLFLLLLCLLLLAPSFNTLTHFFILNQSSHLVPITGKNLLNSKTNSLVLKSILIVLLFTESLLPYIRSGHYNDDIAPRNYLHGAYEVMNIDPPSALKVKRIFIHRKSYFIFQYADDSMEDFYLESKPDQGRLDLLSYEGETIPVQYTYSDSTKILELHFENMGTTITSKALPWRDLPLLQPLFHWTVDGIE